jgi:hypothetical protein
MTTAGSLAPRSIAPLCSNCSRTPRWGGVDIVVVYKIDRLTRSLADFAKIVEILDDRGASTVATLMATGFVVGRRLGMYPIESAIVNACHSGQGSTGDIAILTAANRMQLMPFAQIAARIGGAITVTLTLILFARLSRFREATERRARSSVEANSSH